MPRLSCCCLRIPITWCARKVKCAGNQTLTLGRTGLSRWCFKVCLPGERCYLVLGLHFPYQNGRHRAAAALEEFAATRNRNSGAVVLRSPVHFSFLHKSLACRPNRLRPAIVWLRYISDRSCFAPFTMRLLNFKLKW